MKTVYNESQYSKKAIINKKIESQNGKTLAILCKYYYFGKSKTKKEVLKLLSNFIDESGGSYDKRLLPDLLEKYTSDKEQLLDIESVKITLAEMATIMSREDINEQKVLYAMLVAYKCKNERCRISGMEQFLNNRKVSENFGEYFKDAKVRLGKMERGALLRNLEKDGLIWVDNDVKKTITLNYVDLDEDGVAIELKHFHDIWVDFEIYRGEPYKRCACCGNGFKLKKSIVNKDTSKYCSQQCKTYIHLQQKALSKRKNRHKQQMATITKG